MTQSPHVTIVDADGAPINIPLSVVLASSGTDITASGTAASNAILTLTLPAVADKTLYLTGFSVTVGPGTVGASGLVTATGTIGGTLNYRVGGRVEGYFEYIDFSRPVPASAVNTAIALNIPALGATTGLVAAIIRGYYL